MHSYQAYNRALTRQSSNVMRLSTVRAWHRFTLLSQAGHKASTLKSGDSVACESRNSQKHAAREPHRPPVCAASPDSRPTAPTDDLNEEQLNAVLTSSQTARVKAGPGSGKTRVVVARAHHLIANKGEDPASILAITFTNKAANELKERLKAAAPSGKLGNGGHPQEVLAKTFHGLGAYLLRRTLPYTPQYGLGSNFKILNDHRSEDLIKQGMEQVLKAELAEAEEKKDGAREAAIKSFMEDLPSNVGLLAAGISEVKRWAVAEQHDKETTAVWEAAKCPNVGGKLNRVVSEVTCMGSSMELLQTFYCEYHTLLRLNNALDFEDLIGLSVRTLDENAALRRQWQARFQHILVDEFQDIDRGQYRFVKLLRGEHCGLFVVGDPDQAIYGFRGAEVGIMAESLAMDFPDIETHILKMNYRSVPAIVQAADALLTAPGRPHLYVQPAAVRAPEPDLRVPIAFNVYPNEKEEAKAIANLIRSWVPFSGAYGKGGKVETGQLSRQDIAVLYRKRKLSRTLEEVFVRSGIPYTVVGGRPFWQYEEIQDLLAYLHVILDPQRSDVFLRRIINKPTRELGDVTQEKLCAAADAAGLTLGGLLFGDCCAVEISVQLARGQGGNIMLPDNVAPYAPAIQDDHPLSKIRKPSKPGVQNLRGLVTYVRAQAILNKPVTDLVGMVLELSGCRAEYKKQEEEGKGKKKNPKAKKDLSQEAKERLERLDEVCSLAASPESWYSPDGDDEEEDEMANVALGPAAGPGTAALQSAGKGLAGLAAFLEHAALVTDPQEAVDGPTDTVQIMTLHASKGLEFERVFIVGLEEGTLPSTFKDSDLPEERRVFYVGLTRAKTRLHLSRCETRKFYGDVKTFQESSFLHSLKPYLKYR